MENDEALREFIDKVEQDMACRAMVTMDPEERFRLEREESFRLSEYMNKNTK